jgi:hypothetical protein
MESLAFLRWDGGFEVQKWQGERIESSLDRPTRMKLRGPSYGKNVMRKSKSVCEACRRKETLERTDAPLALVPQA